MDIRNKVHFVSLGCARNLVDSEVMLGILLRAGYEVTEAVGEADYFVINTCGFLKAARDEAQEVISQLFASKKREAKVIVAGCMVNKFKEQLLKLFPYVHYFLGSGDVQEILQAIQADSQGEKIGSVKSYLEEGEVPRQISTPSHYAYLKIAEGCRKGCAYCLIPKIKGPLRSKPIERVVKEFRTLLSQEVQEVILIAQDLGDFGKDSGSSLILLLKEILKVPGDYWLRLLYLYPDEIADELIEILKSDSRLCPYLDMPIQHINDSILKDMRRTTDAEQIKATITKLRAAIPHIHLRTSIIVGFPGEGEREFAELCQFIQKYPLNQIGFFSFSPEKGTAAAELPNQVPSLVKEKRLQRIAKKQQEIVQKLNKKLIGEQLEVVVEEYHPESELLLVGRHRGQAPEVDGQVIINNPGAVSAFGKRYLVKITDVVGYDLICSVIN